MNEVELHLSEWVELETGIDCNTRCCAVGDVHGHSEHLRKLLRHFEKGRLPDRKTRLIFLGDLIDRGPDSLGSLDEAMNARNGRFEAVIALLGNHEQMLRRFIDRVDAQAASHWMYNGGIEVLCELYEHQSGQVKDCDTAEFVRESLGAGRIAFLEQLDSHWSHGNLLFVHGGLNPGHSLEEHFRQHWSEISNLHWAWIRHPFLYHPVHIQGLIVVHGHSMARTVPPHAPFDDLFVPHLCRDRKINLDGGSFVSGCVTGAEFEAHRYRIAIARSYPPCYDRS